MLRCSPVSRATSETLIFFSPIIVGKGLWGRVVMRLLSTFILLSGIGVVSDSKRHLVWVVVLIVPAFIVQWASHTMQVGQNRIWLVPSFYHLPIYILFGYLILKHIFRKGRVTLDHTVRRRQPLPAHRTSLGAWLHYCGTSSPRQFHFCPNHCGRQWHPLHRAHVF